MKCFKLYVIFIVCFSLFLVQLTLTKDIVVEKGRTGGRIKKSHFTTDTYRKRHLQEDGENVTTKPVNTTTKPVNTTTTTVEIPVEDPNKKPAETTKAVDPNNSGKVDQTVLNTTTTTNPTDDGKTSDLALLDMVATPEGCRNVLKLSFEKQKPYLNACLKQNAYFPDCITSNKCSGNDCVAKKYPEGFFDGKSPASSKIEKEFCLPKAFNDIYEKHTPNFNYIQIVVQALTAKVGSQFDCINHGIDACQTQDKCKLCTIEGTYSQGLCIQREASENSTTAKCQLIQEVIGNSTQLAFASSFKELQGLFPSLKLVDPNKKSGCFYNGVIAVIIAQLLLSVFF